MPPWKSPETEARFDLKFVRIQNDLFVGNTFYDNHHKIVKIDKLEERIDELKKSQPTELDAGFVSVGNREIHLYASSDTLVLPVPGSFRESRDKTREVFKDQNPNHVVSG